MFALKAVENWRALEWWDQVDSGSPNSVFIQHSQLARIQCVSFCIANWGSFSATTKEGPSQSQNRETSFCKNGMQSLGAKPTGGPALELLPRLIMISRDKSSIDWGHFTAIHVSFL